MKTTSLFTCPKCGYKKEIKMPTKWCRYFYECENCKEIIESRTGDCCVFCSYGDTKCPIMQGKEDKIK